MKEFKFWANTIPLKYYYPITILFFVLPFSLIFFAQEYFKFTFNIFEVKGISRLNNQIKLLRYMVDRFSFEKGERKRNISYTSYTYSNPNYKGY